MILARVQPDFRRPAVAAIASGRLERRPRRAWPPRRRRPGGCPSRSRRTRECRRGRFRARSQVPSRRPGGPRSSCDPRHPSGRRASRRGRTSRSPRPARAQRHRRHVGGGRRLRDQLVRNGADQDAASESHDQPERGSLHRDDERQEPADEDGRACDQTPAERGAHAPTLRRARVSASSPGSGDRGENAERARAQAIENRF